MTLEQLQQQQQKEIDAYFLGRKERLSTLEQEQGDILSHCITNNEKTQELLNRLLTEQRQAWEEAEKDEIDRLLHAQQLEMEDFLKKQAKREEWRIMLSQTSEKTKARGR